MKKRLLLLALPAFMALSGCSGISVSPKANDLMVEDTLAHEEIFGEAVEAALRLLCNSFPPVIVEKAAHGFVL